MLRFRSSPLVTFALALGLGLVATNTARAAGAVWPQTDMPRFWILGEGSGHVSFDGSFQLTRENYDAEGVPVRPGVMENIRYASFRAHGGFGFTPRLSVFFQADGRGVFALNREQTNISDDDNYGVGDAFLAARWLAYRSRASDRVYPTEWSPDSWLALVETSWVFPLYDRPQSGRPPLGDQSNDFTAMVRLAWYVNEWLGLSGGAGYTYRTAGYAGMVPWNLRADFLFLNLARLRFWLDFQSQETTIRGNNANAFNVTQPDPIPGGSLLFKGYSPTLRTGTLGIGYRIGKEWEAVGSGFITATGVNSAKGLGGSLGFIWRPYQIPEIKYDAYRAAQIKRLRREPRTYRLNPVVRYGFQATIVRVSQGGNYFRINFGRKDGVQAGDTFQVFEPDNLSNEIRRPIAFARVQVSREHESFLRVERRYEQELQIGAGYEVRRVILEDTGGEATFTWE